MAVVLRTEQAMQDYRDIWRYVAKDNPMAADRLLRRFDEKLKLYAHNPGMGASRSQYGQGLRSIPIANYLLFYQPVPGGIRLVRVLHGARRFRRQFFPSA